MKLSLLSKSINSTAITITYNHAERWFDVIPLQGPEKIIQRNYLQVSTCSGLGDSSALTVFTLLGTTRYCVGIREFGALGNSDGRVGRGVCVCGERETLDLESGERQTLDVSGFS